MQTDKKVFVLFRDGEVMDVFATYDLAQSAKYGDTYGGHWDSFEIEEFDYYGQLENQANYFRYVMKVGDQYVQKINGRGYTLTDKIDKARQFLYAGYAKTAISNYFHYYKRKENEENLFEITKIKVAIEEVKE